MRVSIIESKVNVEKRFVHICVINFYNNYAIINLFRKVFECTLVIGG